MSENAYLSGNFAPVEEEVTAFDLDVTGEIPKELEGGDLLANPGLFALMFRAGDLDCNNESFKRDSTAAFERLLHHTREAQESGWQTGRDSRLLAGSIWVSVHGLATLWAGGAYQAGIPHASIDDALTTNLQLIADIEQGEQK